MVTQPSIETKVMIIAIKDTFLMVGLMSYLQQIAPSPDDAAYYELFDIARPCQFGLVFFVIGFDYQASQF